MSSGHEAQLYKLEEKLRGKIKINVLHIISNDENINVLIPETHLFIEITLIRS